MTAVLKLELIGDDFYWESRRGLIEFPAWLRYIRRLGPDKGESRLSQVVAIDASGQFQTVRVQSVRDYTHANSKGSRGIYAYYFLQPGVYEIVDRYAWNKVRRYYVRADGNNYTEITKAEVSEWLRNDTSA